MTMQDAPQATEAITTEAPSLRDLAIQDMLSASDEPGEAPETPAEQPAPLPTEAPPEPLEARLRARAEERAQRQAQEAQAAELAELRALKAAMEAGGGRPPDRASIERELLERVASGDLGLFQTHGVDPRGVLKSLSGAVLNPQQLALQQEIAALKKAQGGGKPDPDEIRKVASEVYEQQAIRAQAEETFKAACQTDDGGAPKFPMAARLSDAARNHRAHALADELRSNGIEVSFQELAEILEGRLAQEYRDLTGGADPSVLRSAAQSSTQVSPQRAATQAASAVITNDLAAAGGPREPLTEEELREAAIAELRAHRNTEQ